ncbi:hypothetical protein BDV34DRAFT_226604 [Aspergillus parasiticus]|uniref:FAD-binding domain-containing protein n=1 Tax=Aspergillus parasiticus TaxID=5067 RepID=A0A5N6DJA8_ASPPA|nr:hypothetical protein BDV34DRAFT_226604 [Aspergillus parasiticus]
MATSAGFTPTWAKTYFYPNTTKNAIYVIIVGAGLTGLAIGLGLKKRGISYVILERQLERDRSWGVTISWSRPNLEKLLPSGILARLHECTPDPSWFLKEDKGSEEAIVLSDGQNKETLVNIPLPGAFRLNIKKTKRLWSQYVNIKEGKRVSSVEVTPDLPIVVCDDGSREHGSVTIGAECSGSQIRRWLLGKLAEPEVLPCTMLYLTVQYSAEHTAALDRMVHPVIDVGIHPKGMYMGFFLLDKPDLRQPETWSYYILSSWSEKFRVDGEKDLNRFQSLQARMDDWAEPFASGVAWAPKDLEVKEDVMKIWSPSPWNNYSGSITLAGGAAHSMTWHAFQFIKAIETVVRGEAPLQAAIEAYEKDVIARGVKEVAISKAQMESAHNHSSYKNSHVARHGVDPVA